MWRLCQSAAGSFPFRFRLSALSGLQCCCTWSGMAKARITPKGEFQGQTDVPLSELGRRQSEAVADALCTQPVDAVYSSPLRRAMETARLIAEGHKLSVCADARLMELNVGVFQDRLRSELAETYPLELARWLGGDEDFAIPGGESRRQLAERGCEALRSIATAGHCCTVVVTHGGLLSATLRSLLDLPQALPPFSLQNGAHQPAHGRSRRPLCADRAKRDGTFESGGTVARWRLVRLVRWGERSEPHRSR